MDYRAQILDARAQLRVRRARLAHRKKQVIITISSSTMAHGVETHACRGYTGELQRLSRSGDQFAAWKPESASTMLTQAGLRRRQRNCRL